MRSRPWLMRAPSAEMPDVDVDPDPPPSLPLRTFHMSAAALPISVAWFV